MNKIDWGVLKDGEFIGKLYDYVFYGIEYRSYEYRMREIEYNGHWGFCSYCHIKAREISRQQVSQTERGWRGSLRTSWTEITFKCDKCGITDRVSMGDESEEDVTYYSNEETRAYNLY